MEKALFGIAAVLAVTGFVCFERIRHPGVVTEAARMDVAACVRAYKMDGVPLSYAHSVCGKMADEARLRRERDRAGLAG